MNACSSIEIYSLTTRHTHTVQSRPPTDTTEPSSAKNRTCLHAPWAPANDKTDSRDNKARRTVHGRLLAAYGSDMAAVGSKGLGRLPRSRRRKCKHPHEIKCIPLVSTTVQTQYFRLDRFKRTRVRTSTADRSTDGLGAYCYKKRLVMRYVDGFDVGD